MLVAIGSDSFATAPIMTCRSVWICTNIPLATRPTLADFDQGIGTTCRSSSLLSKDKALCCALGPARCVTIGSNSFAAKAIMTCRSVWICTNIPLVAILALQDMRVAESRLAATACRIGSSLPLRSWACNALRPSDRAAHSGPSHERSTSERLAGEA